MHNRSTASSASATGDAMPSAAALASAAAELANGAVPLAGVASGGTLRYAKAHGATGI